MPSTPTQVVVASGSNPSSGGERARLSLSSLCSRWLWGLRPCPDDGESLPPGSPRPDDGDLESGPVAEPQGPSGVQPMERRGAPGARLVVSMDDFTYVHMCEVCGAFEPTEGMHTRRRKGKTIVSGVCHSCGAEGYRPETPPTPRTKRQKRRARRMGR